MNGIARMPMNSSGSSPPQGKHSKGQKSSEPDRHHKDESKTGDKRRCYGCNRVGHDRVTCRMTDHPDFVKTGLWAGSATERAIRLWEKDESKIQLPLTRLLWCGTLSIPLPDHQLLPELTHLPTDAGRGRGERDNDRRNDRRGRGGHGTVHFDTKDKGTLCWTDVITHLSCNCGGADINNTFRQCLVFIRPSTTSFTVLTLFDTGA